MFAEAKKIILDDNAAILSKLQEGQAKVAAELQTVQGGALLNPDLLSRPLSYGPQPNLPLGCFALTLQACNRPHLW